MKFDKNRVYTALNADELKIGSKVYVADSLETLKRIVDTDEDPDDLIDIEGEDYGCRFYNGYTHYALAYLVSLPEEKKLRWTDLKVGDVVQKKVDFANGYRIAMVVRIDTYETDKHICLDGEWLDEAGLEKYEKVE